MNVLAIEDIHLLFEPEVEVLCGVGFSVGAGEVVGLLGRNGAGKTTLLQVVMGMLVPQEGRVRVFGLDPRQKPVEVKHRIGYVSEDQVLPESAPVREVFDFHRRLFPGWDAALARELSRGFELERKARIGALSKGQKRQVALLCAVAHRPDLLILDEPGKGLDPAARRELLQTAIRLLAESGTTILFSSHHLNDVERLAGRVVLLEKGRALLDEPLDRLREEYSLAILPQNASPFREKLLALPDCLRVRRRQDSLHAVIRRNPPAARALLRQELGIANTPCNTLPLEELFVELVGRKP